MCGIAGLFHYAKGSPADGEVLSRMTDVIAHRGPDGRGTFIDGAAGLGHRRLAILDPTPRGAQPMASGSGRLSITFNGEIYNFRELRAELESRGRRFRTTTDTEVILEAWEEWGLDAVRRLNGIYAFGLWDARERTLHLVRDRFGVKPLYVHDDGATIRFASEIKAILADASVAIEADWNGLRAVLELGYTAAPHTCFRAIRQIDPATIVSVRQGGSSTITKTWELQWPPADGRDALERFDAALDRAVTMQMVSDVPIGAFLSGGLDSTRIVQAMARADPSTRAFTVGFTAGAFDESAIARDTAKHLGVQHEVETIDLDLAATAVAVSEAFDDPFADSSALAVYHLCRVAARQVKVVLSGDGADEILGGYATHGLNAIASVVRATPAPLRRAAMSLASAALPVADHPYSARSVARRLLRAGGEPPARAHASWRRYFFDNDERELLTPAALHALHAADDPIEAYARPYRGASKLRAALSADLLFYLPNDMLTKVDRASMAFSLEARVPMLEHNLVDLVWSLPDDEIRRRLGKGKAILRESIRRRMPWYDLRRPKRGFLVPIAAGFRGDLAVLLRDLLASRFASEAGVFDLRSIERRLQRHEQRQTDASFELYACLMVLLWWKRFFG